MTGDGKRHFWRYIDARTGEVRENRYEIAQLIACQGDEPRYIGDQDVFAMQEQVIEQILSADLAAEAKAAAPPVVDSIQQTLAEELKDALRRQTVDRELAKRVIRFLGQPMGRALHVKLKGLYESWVTARDDGALLAAAVAMADEFGKERPAAAGSGVLRREDLTLVCFEYVSG